MCILDYNVREPSWHASSVLPTEEPSRFNVCNGSWHFMLTLCTHTHDMLRIAEFTSSTSITTNALSTSDIGGLTLGQKHQVHPAAMQENYRNMMIATWHCCRAQYIEKLIPCAVPTAPKHLSGIPKKKCAQIVKSRQCQKCLLNMTLFNACSSSEHPHATSTS
jgi:hypothetical protein